MKRSSVLSLLLIIWTITTSLMGLTVLAGDGDLPEGTSQSWLESVLLGMEIKEYNFFPAPERQGQIYRAPNRAHGFSVYLSGTGMRLVSDDPAKTSWDWGLEFITEKQSGTWGGEYQDEEASVEKADITVKDNRLEIDRGNITEWYVNDEKGLKQGFTVLNPIPSMPRGKLNIDMKIVGCLFPKFSEDGQAIDFHDDGNFTVLSYSRLIATDAEGRVLPSRFEPIGGGIRISITDAEATYPVTIDPLATDPGWSYSYCASEASCGYSVGTAGDVNGDGYNDVIIGVLSADKPLGSDKVGAAYIFLGSPSGLMSSPYWGASGDQYLQYFGCSVGTAGDVNGDGYSDVIVGARGYDHGETDEGIAFVYFGAPYEMDADPDWSVEGNSSSANFGCSVGTAGDVNGDGYSDVIVGASGYSNGQTNEGRAFVYLGSGYGLAISPQWFAESQQGQAHFGSSVGTAGDVNGDGYGDVVVGAPDYDTSFVDSGRAYVYLGTSGGLQGSAAWTQESGQTSGYFGSSAGTAGDFNGDGYSDLLVGAKGYDKGQTDEGVSALYLGSASGLSTVHSWIAECNSAGASFGASVGTAGDINGDGFSDVIIGAPLYTNDLANEGGAFVYLGCASGFPVADPWIREGNSVLSHFGFSAFTAGDVNGDGYSDVLVGVPNSDNVCNSSSAPDAGKALLYHGSPSGLSSTAAWSPQGDQATSYFGYSVSSAGDVNGDGYSDVLVGAPMYDNGENDEGRVFVYLGSASGLSSAPGWTAEGGQASAYFGYSAAGAGDVNGDGYSDVLVGALMHDNGQTNEGRAYLYQGSSFGLSASPFWTAEGDQDLAGLGVSVAPAGDVNGDGYSDVIVGAYGYDSEVENVGRALVYLGSAGGLSSSYSWTAESGQSNSLFGYSVGTAGDVNGDGYSDVVVGAHNYDGTLSDEGYAFLYTGSSTGLSAFPAWTKAGGSAGAYFGCSVGTAGDVNGDGYSDVIIGAYGFDNPETDEGAAYIFFGSAGGLPTSYNLRIQSDQASAQLGRSVASAGDVNGDGYSDIIIGAYYYDNGHTNEGCAFLHMGSATGLFSSSGWTAEGDQASAYFGFSAGQAGDVNGDGYSDLAVGAYGYDGAQTDGGTARLYYGNGGDGKNLALQQLRSDLSPISPLGRADEDYFRMKMLLRTPFGRGDARLEWQVAPLGGTLTPALNPVQSDPIWRDTGTGGYDSPRGVALPPDHGPYLWRARVRYNPASVPFQVHGPWFTIAANAMTETDLRCVPAGAACSAPAGLIEETVKEDKSGFTWTNLTGADHYRIVRATRTGLPSYAFSACVGYAIADGSVGADVSGDNPAQGECHYYIVQGYDCEDPDEYLSPAGDGSVTRDLAATTCDGD